MVRLPAAVGRATDLVRELCLGQNLARLELGIVFSTLPPRIPGLRLAVPAEQLKFKDSATVYGIHELPVVW